MHDDREDRALIERCVSGDRRAWSQLVERFSRYVYFLVGLTTRRCNVVVDPDEHADLHNDVFVALLEDEQRRLRSFEGRNGCSVRAWVRLLTIRRTLDTLRRRRPHLSLTLTDDDAPAREPESPTPDPLTALLDREDSRRAERLDELAADLNEPDRALLTLLFVHGLSPGEAADALRIPRGALYTRKNRLIGRLRARAEALGLIDPVAEGRAE